MLSSLLTHLNPSSNKNLPLAISDITSLEMRLCESRIDYMSMVHVIVQWMNGMIIDHLIPLFEIANIKHDRYPVVKSRYLAGDTALVNCDLFQLSGLLSSEETRQQVLGISIIPLSITSVNCVSTTHNNPQNERLVPLPHQPTTQSSNVTYPPKRGVSWKCIAAMM